MEYKIKKWLLALGMIVGTVYHLFDEPTFDTVIMCIGAAIGIIAGAYTMPTDRNIKTPALKQEEDVLILEDRPLWNEEDIVPEINSHHYKKRFYK